MTIAQTPEVSTRGPGIRGKVRHWVVGLSGVSAVLYLLIGLRVVTVLPDDPTGQTSFGLVASAGFAVAAIVAATFDKRLLWALGTVGLAFVIWAYFDLASERTPPFETWGVIIRLVQLPLLAAVGYLAIRPGGTREEPPR
jgi:hypothetical protein